MVLGEPPSKKKHLEFNVQLFRPIPSPITSFLWGFFSQDESVNITTAAEAAQKLGDISSDEGVNDGNDKAANDDSAAGAGGCDFDMVRVPLLNILSVY